MNTKKRVGQVFFAIVCYLCGVTIFSIYTYFDTRQKLTGVVDKKLLVAAYATNDLLGPGYHNGMDNKDTIWYDLDYQIALKLKDFTQKINIAYVYTMIEDEGAIRFATSSPTEEEIASKNYEKTYYTLYPEADPAIYKSFKDKIITYAEYEDRWGNFRSIFIPMVSTDKTPYVVGADVNISEIKSIAYRSSLGAFLVCIFLGLIGLPLIYFYVKSVRQELKLELRRRFRDPLTGLANRSSLLDRLDKADKPSLAIINIDSFREITNIYGSDIGDDVLLQLKNRLLDYCQLCDKTIKVYRLHSDEFALYTEDFCEDKSLKHILEAMRTYVQSYEYRADEKAVNLSVTIGAVAGHKKALIFADMALREAKDKCEPVVVYESRLLLPERYAKNLQCAQQLKLAMKEDRLQAYFQPIKNVKSHKVEKYEVLARVADQQGKILLMPDEFIPVALRTKQYTAITRSILQQGLALLNQYSDADFKVSINISMTDINDSSTRNYILKTIAESKMGKRLEFELLESEEIKNIQDVIDFIQVLKEMHVSFGIDDLGKDYSNFDRLMKLPVDFLKIDGSIMSNILDNDDAYVVARKIVEVAKHKNIKTVAEYCYSAEIESKAVSLDVDYVQGYHIGRPASLISISSGAIDQAIA